MNGRTLCLLSVVSLLLRSHAVSPPLCNASQLLTALRGNEVAWLLRSEPLYSACAFVSARYNCSRFNTSAAHYRLGWRPELEPAPDCSLPSRHSALAALQRPLHLLILGDSHAVQLYESLLCAFQAEARSVVAFINGERTVFAAAADAPACHSVAYSDYAYFWLDDAPGAEGECNLNHAPEHVSCFELRGSRLCCAYARPLHGSAPLQAAERGLAALNLSLASFDVLALNEYLEASVLGRQLRMSGGGEGFPGRVLALPKFSSARQLGTVRSEPARAPPEPRPAARLDAFCAQLSASWRQSRCTPLDFWALAELRSGDAKASIFPTSYPAAGEPGGRRVCHALQREDREDGRCDGGEAVPAEMRVCDQPPCAQETHFCLPGPTDDFGLLLLAAAAGG